MDFSTVSLALTSLSRRTPPLSDEVLRLSSRLSSLVVSSSSASNDNVIVGRGEEEDGEYVTGALRFIELGSSSSNVANGNGQEQQQQQVVVRWEPLAVGLLLLVDYLSNRTQELSPPSTSPGVYADGPRIPEVTTPYPPITTTTTATTSSGCTVSASATPTSLLSINTTNSPIFQLLHALPSIVDTHIEHAEPRVRSLVARTVGAYALYTTSLLLLTKGNDDDTAMADRVELTEAIHNVQVGRRRIHTAILRSLNYHFQMKEPDNKDSSNQQEQKQSRSSDGALDDTTGWRALETNLNALACYIDGCVGTAATAGGGGGGGSYVDEEISLFLTKPNGQEWGNNGDDDDDDRSWFLPGLQYCCTTHVNRHVRAAGAALLGALVSSCVRSSHLLHTSLLMDSDNLLRAVIGDALRATLADNWSQVRMAGSVLCRGYVLALMQIVNNINDDEDEEIEKTTTTFEMAIGDLVPMLLPRMCLNRFYLAQGVKLYSQETWRLIFGPSSLSSSASDEGGGDDGALHYSSAHDGGGRAGGGIGAVSRNAAPICRYYAKMCDADNHAVREAACQGIAELAQKVGSHAVYANCLSPYVMILLQALIMCFHDESWPVRDEACLACGTFCIAYANECRPELPTLFARWTEQLTDQIWSVREDAAVALGDAIVAYGPEMFEKVLTVLRERIPAARDQPAMSREEYKKLQNDAAAHTGNQLYSCGSLAPKLKKGSGAMAAAAAALSSSPVEVEGASGIGGVAMESSRKAGAGRIGCMSCFIDRPRSPWEATDGCVYLLKELCVRFANVDVSDRSDVVVDDATLLSLMTDLADVCRLSHYPQSDDLRTTLWKQLPPIAEALGKRRFKGLYLDLFVDLLAKNLDDSSGSGATQLSIHAAGQCAEELATLIGIGVFRGRLESTGGQGAFDRVMQERKREHQMCGLGFVH